MQERLVHRQLEVVDAAPAQLGGGVVVAEPSAPAVADKRLAGLGFLTSKNPGAQPASLGGIGELMRGAFDKAEDRADTGTPIAEPRDRAPVRRPSVPPSRNG